MAALIYLIQVSWLRLMLKDRRCLRHLWIHMSRADIKHPRRLFLFLPQRWPLWLRSAVASEFFRQLSLLLMFSCRGRRFFLSWKLQELSRLLALNICPSLQQQNIIMQIRALLIRKLFKLIQTLSQAFEYLNEIWGKQEALHSCTAHTSNQ